MFAIPGLDHPAPIKLTKVFEDFALVPDVVLQAPPTPTQSADTVEVGNEYSVSSKPLPPNIVMWVTLSRINSINLYLGIKLTLYSSFTGITQWRKQETEPASCRSWQYS